MSLSSQECIKISSMNTKYELIRELIFIHSWLDNDV